MEKYRDGQRELHCVFVDLEKAYDRVPREELWYCMRKSGVAEKYVRVVQDMYERSRTVVRCAVGQTEEFNVEVGLHQGSALSPFLFAIVMDQLSEEVRQESPWTMMFADDIVICSESREQVEENLERWRFALERRGMKVSRSKTEYMCVNEREGSGTIRSEYRTQTMPELQKLHPSSMIREDMALTVCGAQQWESIKNRLCTRSMTQTSLRRTGKGFSEQVGASNMMIQAKWGDSGSASVLFTMLQERENLVTAPEHVLLSIKRTFPNPKLGFVRSVLHRSDIESIGKDDKLSILEYVLSDGRYEELNGLQLLPLSDGSFRSFTNQEEDTALIDNEKFSRVLLPFFKERFLPDDLNSNMVHHLRHMSMSSMEIIFKALTTDKFGCKTM
ncbi:hypothetical protein QTP70_026889 [Hemibagrus guttatus]|uniref:ribonuclease H n=1 Tax=Hemibagrus guttatus TaxID=175788 RepID=A0AAE0V7Y8_9TELE|nr:hypothetical protein QTP70_026889 [Hemibagrus guttatus]